MAILSIKVAGLEGVTTKLNNAVASLADFTKPFEAAVNRIMEIENQIFESQGRGQWQPLAPATIARKGHDRILYDTGALQASLASQTPNTIIQISPERLAFGTSVPYAHFHHFGTSRMPRRGVLLAPDELNDVIGACVREWLPRTLFG